MILSCSIISLILLIWFRTEAWLEYTRLFRLNFLSFYKDYDQKRQKDITLNYQIYLRRYHDCFFVRMITCPICLAVWLSMGAVLLQAAVTLVLAAMFHLGTGFLLLGIWSAICTLPFLILGSIVIFAIIDRLLG